MSLLIDSTSLPQSSFTRVSVKETVEVKKAKKKSTPTPAIESVVDFVSIPIPQSRLDTRPSLDKPSLSIHAIEKDTALISKLQSFMDHTETSELGTIDATQMAVPEISQEEVLVSEILFLRAYIEIMQEQRTLKKSDMTIANDLIHTLNEVNNKLREDHFNQSNDFLSRLKASKILGWVNKLIYGATAVLGVSSIGVTIATGGAALPAVLAIANGIAALGSGVGTIAKAILDHQQQKNLGSLEEIKLKKYITDQKIKDGIREMGASMREVWRNWKEIFTVVNNWTKTSLTNQR